VVGAQEDRAVSAMTGPGRVRAQPGDLVVAVPGGAAVGGRPAPCGIGVVSRTDKDGRVLAYIDVAGCVQPVAFLPGSQAALLLVPQNAVDVAAALATVSDHGEITSAGQARAVIRPHLTPLSASWAERRRIGGDG
jgi:hypothetical protein